MTTLYPLTHKLRLGATLLLLCGLSVVGFAQTFTGNVTFSTQADLDAFLAPGGAKFVTVNGDVTINPTGVFTNFSNVSALQTIQGDFEIKNYNTNQTIGDPLAEFASLTTTEDLIIESSTGITSIVSPTLVTIQGDFEVANIAGSSAAGFGGNLTMTNLSTIQGDFVITSVTRLTSFTTPSLTTIGGDINFNTNNDLGNLSGLSLVTSVGGGVLLQNNPRLDNVTALGGPSASRLDVTNLVVSNNRRLQNFGTGNNTFRIRVTNSLVISNNIALGAVGGNIEAGIGGGDATLSLINISGNGSNTLPSSTFSIAPIFDKGHTVTVGNYQLNNNPRLTSPSGSQPVKVTANLEVINNPLLTELPNFGGSGLITTSLSGDLTISANADLISLGELEFVTTVAGAILISNNNDLTSLEVFNRLTQAGVITIQNNSSITNLDDFTAVSLNVDVTFVISNNAQLGNCCAPTCKTTVAGVPFDGTNNAVAISNNTGDCQDKQAVVDACADEPGKECLAAAAPVEFIAFTGQLNGNYVELNWATATETENDYFQVERSNDGVNFVALGQVAGAGDSQQELDYSYLDYDFQAGANYYRLRQVDYDGTQDFSDVIVVDAGGAATALGIYPNPASSGNVNVALDNGWNKERLTLDVFSASGQHVYQLTSVNGAKFELPADRLSPGMYAVRVTDGARTLTERLVIR